MFYKLKTKIRYSKVGNKIVEYIMGTILVDVLYKILDFFRLTDSANIKNIPNEKTCSFFENNKERIEKNISCLEDKKSKQIYGNIIKYRCFQDRKFLPEFSFYSQYFPKDIIKLSNEEVFIDCGAYTGDSISKFIKNSKNKYKKIVAFDADKTNLSKIQKKQIKNCICFDLGVWNKKDILTFVEDNTMFSKLEQTDVKTSGIKLDAKKVVINVEAIDNIKECEDMTFLKMDIEGSELNALKGAEKTIRRNKPKLAICIYHSDEDMINIIEWIVNLNMNYKLYVRHHSGKLEDTVVYAI